LADRQKVAFSHDAIDQLIRPQECYNFDPAVKSRLFRQGAGRRPIRLVDFKSLLATFGGLTSLRKKMCLSTSH
jgi:hypothetical protein